MPSLLWRGGSATTLMFRHVLIPTDPHAREPVVNEFGFNVAAAFDASVYILAVLEGGQQRDQLRADHEAEARDAVDEILGIAADHGLVAEGEVRSGRPHEEILELVGDSDIDLIVMGTEARTGVDRFLLGSVAEKVIRESPVPVLTVTPDAEPPTAC